MVRRFVYFKDRAHKIIEFNKSGKSYAWGLNIFGDMTPQEQSELERPPLHRRIWSSEPPFLIYQQSTFENGDNSILYYLIIR